MHLQGGGNVYIGIDGKEKKGKTDSNGEVTFDNVEIQSYTVKELDAERESFKRNIGLTKLITLKEDDTDKVYQFTMEQKRYGAIKIQKKSNGGTPLEGVGFRLYVKDNNGTYTSKYRLADTDSEGKTSSSSALETRNSSIKLNGDHGVDVNTEYTILPGTYYLYEYKNPNPGYFIQYQGQRYDEGRGAFIGEVTIEAGKITDVDGLTYKYHNPLTDKDEYRAYNINEPFATIIIEKSVEKLNEQTGEISKMALQGAGFKLQKDGKWISLSNVTDSGTTTEFFTDSDGNLSIKKIPVNATYALYETTFPDGVDPTIQPGYDPTLKAVKIATIKVREDGSIFDTTYEYKAISDSKDDVQIVKDTTKINSTTSYRRIKVHEKKISATGNGEEAKAYLQIINHKYINIAGYVWEDIGADTKNPGNGNNKYKEAMSEKDKELQNITVNLYKKGTPTPKATATTDSAGKYKFNNIMAQDIKNGNYYIEFDYSSYVNANSNPEQKIYKPVTPTINATNGSKALTIDVLPKEDERIIKDNLYKAYTGYGEDGVGAEVQHYNTLSKVFKEFEDSKLNVTDWIYKDSGESIYTLHYINLGIMEMKNPEFTISQNLEKAILNVNGYEYTYLYGEKGKATNYNKNDVVKPTVNWQSKTDISAFTQKIYPSCIPTDSNNVNTTLKIIYEIVITNNTNTDILGYYKEHELIIKQGDLKDEWDPDRYELSAESKNKGWVQQVSGFAKYNKDIIMKKSETTEEKLYISFDVKQGAIKDLLNHPNGICENAPTKATAIARHKYTRYDYSWKQSKSTEDKGKGRATWRFWAIDNKNSAEEVVEGKEGKTHLSIPETQWDSAPYLALQVNEEEKTISGTVFKDRNTRSSTHEVVGNGIYLEGTEKNVSNVKVELLKSDFKTPAERYILKKEVKNGVTNYSTEKTTDEIKTDEEGKYSFVGVVPGVYYIKFTYGDGTQEIVDATNGNKKVTSNEYKSTVVTDEKIQNAFNKKGINGEDITSKEYIWYLYSNNNYNKAIDRAYLGTDDKRFDKTKKIDYRTINNADSTKSLKASRTPLISVPIEFDTKTSGDGTSNNTYKPKYENMHFGIIEKPNLNIKIRKEITNIKVTLQNGQVLTVGNPTQNIAYTANLDQEWPTPENGKIGSKNVKIETDDRYLYGSTLEIRYTLTIENESDVTYLSEDYYKYGKYPTNKAESEATVAINTLTEYVDPDLEIKVYSDLKEGSSDQEYTYSDTLEPTKYIISNLKQTNTNQNAYRLALDNLITKYNIENEYYKELYEIGNSNNIINGKELTTKYGANDKANSKTDLKVVAEKSISGENDEMEYVDYSQVSKITTSINTYSDPTAAPFETVISAYKDIPTDSARLIATTSTGLDRSMKHIISVTILLIGIAGVIVCVKKIKN